MLSPFRCAPHSATQTKEGATVCHNSLFSLGRTVATPGVLAALEELGVAPATLFARHHRGDWGDLSAEDAEANDRAL